MNHVLLILIMGYSGGLIKLGDESQTLVETAIARLDGSNIIWIEPKFDLVTVVRWIDNQKFDEFCGKVLNSLKD